MQVALLLLAILWSGPVLAGGDNPVIGSAAAVKGGKFVWGALSYPKSLNYPVSGDGASARIYSLVVETLCEASYESGEYVPLVAARWEISDDKKIFTFHLNKKAKFSDGSAVTTKDVKAFWDIVHNPDNIIGALRASFDKFEKIEVIDAHTLRIHAKSPHFSNLDTICMSFMVTSHKFWLAQGKNFNKAFNSKLFGSGPYVLHKVKKGKRVELQRNKNYWGAHLPQNVGRYNFDTFVYRAVEDTTVRFELFKKGEIDMLSFNVAKRWKTETGSAKFKKNWVIARRADTQDPQGFSGVIINTRRKPLDDVRVRKALAHTYHREKFIKDLFYNSYDRLVSYWPASIFSNPNNVMIDFNLKKARKLLQEAGYTKTNSSGVLIGKDGKPFSVDYFYISKTSERHLTIWKEDLRKVGIDLQLKQTTWPTLVKKWDKYEFSLAGVAWGASLNPDPFEMWHAKFKDQPAGNNLAGFTSKRLDELIVKIGPIFDRNQRAPLFHEMDSILFNAHPYILGWSLSYLRIGYWNKFGLIHQFAPRYGDGYSVWQYAWYDAAKHKVLKAAVKANKSLPSLAGIKGPHSTAVTGRVADKNPRVANSSAPQGGTLVIGRTSYPKSLNFPISGDRAAKMVYELVVENLCTLNAQSGEYVPLIAARWDISPDGKVFTFYLNKKAKFADGTPVTTKDVQAFWDILHNPKNIIGGVRSELSKFTKLEVIDTHTVKLYAQTARFSNLSTLCYYFGVTSHKYYLAKGTDYNKSFSNKIFGSGPYLIDKVKKGKMITLVRNKNYWGAHLPQNVGRYNFDKVVFRTVEDATIRFELFKKGKIDMFSFSDAKRWKMDTASEKFQKNWVVARRVDSHYPRSFRGIAINTRVKPFDDVRVRKALAHTYDRDRYIAKLYYGIYEPLQSYWPGSIFSSPKNELVKFDLKAARRLLKEAGYSEVNSKGMLVKKGKPLVVDYLYASKRQERYLTIWKEDLHKVGIDLKLELVTWPTLMKKLHNKEFVLIFIGWGGALNPDPHSMWHSQFLAQQHGSNLSGFTAQELDDLLVKSGKMFDRQQRIKLFHRMDEILFNNHPFILHWSISFLRVGYWNKFGFLPKGAPLQGGFNSVWQYAWHDPQRAVALQTAMQADKALPAIAGLRGPRG